MERQSRAAGGDYQVLVIPLLAEGGRREHLDRVLVVDVPEATQLERLVQRDGVPLAQAEAALRAQATRDARLAFADDVIENDADLAALDNHVAQLHSRYRALAARARP
jgi:dephospho-CoA kinase